MLRAAMAGIMQSFADARYQYKNTVSKLTPTTGQTVSFANSDVDQVMYLAPAGTLASLTVQLPSDASSRTGQRVTICSSQIVTSLTLSGAATVMNTITSLVSSDCFTFVKIDTNTWAKN